MVLCDELRNMRYSLKVSGKAQTSDGGPGGKIALPRGYGGAAHNFNPANPPGGKDASVRGDKRPCFKRAKEPDYLMDSTQATLAELRDAERSIVSRKKLGVEEANKPREPTPGWYGNKGKEFSNDMETYMRNLNSQSRWKPKDEAHYQSALEKTGLDLGGKGQMLTMVGPWGGPIIGRVMGAARARRERRTGRGGPARRWYFVVGPSV